MDLIKLAISKPVGVTVGVLLVVMFGLIGLGAIPVQLTPTVDRPVVTVTTEWTGRSPEEIVDEIAKKQEEELKNLSGLKTMRSVSNEGRCEVTLEFFLETNIDRALQEVSDKLRQVSDYPEEVEEPRIEAADSASENAIAWMIIDVDPDSRHLHPDFDVSTLYDALDKEVKPFLERIDGVSEINIYGGREREVRVLMDMSALAQRGLNPLDVIDAIRGENVNISAGTIAEGKRDYRVRVVGRFDSPDQVLNTVISYRDGMPVYLRDVAEVEVGYERKRGFVRSLGMPCIAMNCKRRTGANVVDVMEGLRGRLDEVRAEILPKLGGEVGPHLRLRQVYDETTYIDSAINLVTQNLYIGGAIAAVVLLIFLRSLTATGVIALAIPISVIGTFLVLLGLGRSLNVVSLAGLAFAVGMVVDNAIVVLENISRHLREGKPAMRAAYFGAREVWGAILASTLTTIAVFVPVLTIQEEAGQLFRDIALAVVASVSLSLIVSIMVIPVACSRWLRSGEPKHSRLVHTCWDQLFGLVPIAAGLVNKTGDMVHWSITGWRSWSVRPAVIVAMTAASLIGAVLLMPPMDYLPTGNRNLVFGGLLLPPGMSLEKRVEYAEQIEQQILPYAAVDASDPKAVAKLDPIFRREAPDQPFKPVAVENFFIGAFSVNMFVGGTSANERVVLPIGALLSNAMSGIPDTFGGASQSSLFTGVRGGNTIDLEVSGPRLEKVTRAASWMFNTTANLPTPDGGTFGYQLVSPDPANFTLPQQEWKGSITRLGRELGLSTRTMGAAVRSLFDGAFAGEYLLGGENIDIMLLPAGGRLDYKEQLASVPIATPAGPIVPLSQVVQITPSTSPQTIQRFEELPSVTIRVTPPAGMTIDEIEQEIKEQVIAPARENGLVDATMRLRLEGTAAKLDEVKASLFGVAPEAEDQGASTLRSAGLTLSIIMFAGVVALVAWRTVRLVHRSQDVTTRTLLRGIVGSLLGVGLLASLLITFSLHPELATARLVWALMVTYLLMCALFESFVYPFVIMFSVPLAIVGGFAGLAIVHAITLRDPTIAPQQLDVLTMLGFIILIGVVVNNAILLVHLALQRMRGLDPDSGEPTGAQMAAPDAIAQAVRLRMRPIFMSTLTSVGGMLPLVLFPGAGSEMYRGLGSVVVGGLLVSTVFTLVLVPMMFSVVVDLALGVRTLFGMPSQTRPLSVTASLEQTPSSSQLSTTAKAQQTATPHRAVTDTLETSQSTVF